MLDSIALERRGIPATAVGVKKFISTTGMAMARIQGFPDLRVAVLDDSYGVLMGMDDPKEIEALAEQTAQKVERILLGDPGDRPLS